MNLTTKYILGRRGLTALFPFLLLLACTEPFELDTRPQTYPCVNSILNPDSTVRLTLSYTRPIDSNQAFKPIEDANISLFEDHKLWGILTHSENGNYELNKTPSIGKTYQLEIYIPDELPISAETTIPSRLTIDTLALGTTYADDFYPTGLRWITAYTITSKEKLFRCWNYEIYKDNPDYDYFYFQAGLSYLSPYADNFNRQTDQVYKLGFYYHFYVRQSNEIKAGSGISFTKSNLNKYSIDYYFSADEHYDKYMKSRIQSWIISEWNDLPFNEPVQLYSNVTNAMGIFGSATFTSINYINLSSNE